MSIEVRGSLLLAFWLAATGCGVSGPDCRDETRSVSAATALTSMLAAPLASDTGTASISLHEARNYRSKATSTREIMWFVSSGLVRSGVTAVHLHEVGSGRLLFTLPIDAGSGPPYVITQVFTRQTYDGAVDFAAVYELVGTGGTYLEVHTSEHPDGRLRGTLQAQSDSWREFTHSFCS